MQLLGGQSLLLIDIACCSHDFSGRTISGLRGLSAGFWLGNTPLIKLSPKKTWEGFAGGLIMTVLASWWLGEYMSRFKWMICPRTVSIFPGASSLCPFASNLVDFLHCCWQLFQNFWAVHPEFAYGVNWHVLASQHVAGSLLAIVLQAR